ncbi:anhydro-N-acetylmuramic acid kinase [Aliidiomarina minuta]|uniref:Anhydro-N-acetylmuramic acid kinase n=1 Tax=Aliidiomarina minuta TaxID=880057 RepID=A0A432W484_9GAMM|nr:anhydro-N-acetylmuramic acid kinase [Aliidiomarina minuta]RUO24295.1 anhydro-N-acetylmuramic acid kinase [Aliidiomarina minuta]
MTNYYLGLMSGTSLDGLDIALTQFDERGQPKLVCTDHQPLPTLLKKSLFQLTQVHENELIHYGHCDREFALFCANAVNQLLRQQGIKSSQIRAIGSHGQTVRHYPERVTPFSLQLGCPATLAAETGINVIAGFRQKDIALGGQGAPLAPAFHHHVFNDQQENRAVLNIGGIANLSYLPQQGPVQGFDSGPGNCLLDYWYSQHNPGSFDANGDWGRQGELNKPLLQRLLTDPYFQQPAPKSTGREYFSPKWLNEHLANSGSLKATNVQRTLAEFTAASIRLGLLQYSATACYVCGGGVHNQLLLDRLKALMPTISFTSTQALGVDPDWVEAMAFAWLAWCYEQQRPGNLPSVTGASRPAILGALYPAK